MSPVPDETRPGNLSDPDQDDPGRREEWLASHHARWSTPEYELTRILTQAGVVPIQIDRLLAGQANEVYAVSESNGSEFILRIARRPDPRFETEEAVIGLVRQAGVPAPEVLATGPLEIDGAASAFILERRLPGVMLRDLILAEPGAVTSVLEELGEILAMIHEITVSGFGNLNAQLSAPYETYSAWFVDVFVDRHLPSILSAVQDNDQAVGLLNRAGELLVGHREILDRASPRLAHGDVSPTNVLVASGRISGIVDWEAAKGAPRANDFAWWTSGTVSLAQPPDPDAILAGYQRVTSLEPEFWELFKLCQLRITAGLVGYGASVEDRTVVARALARLRDLVDAFGQ